MRAFARNTQGQGKKKKPSRYESRSKVTEFMPENGDPYEEYERQLMEKDQQEMMDRNKHYLMNLRDTKTLDVKIMDLREDPSNVDLLLQVLSRIVMESEIIREEGEGVKDFDIVNYILANALKADKI